MKLIFKILLFLIPIVVKADQPRVIFEHFSNNKRFVLQLMINENKVCDYSYLENNKWNLNECYWRVIDSFRKKEMYRFQKGNYDWFIEDWVYVTDDGLNSVAVNDWPAWGLDSTTKFITFFSKNKELKSFKASEILSNFKHKKSSVSHYWWYNYAKLTKNEFELEIFDMTRFRFSLKNGELISKQRDNHLDLNTIRVRGKIEPTELNTFFLIKIYCVLYGKAPLSQTIKFKVDKRYLKKFKSINKYSDGITICIRDGYYLKTEDWQEYAPCVEQ